MATQCANCPLATLVHTIWSAWEDGQSWLLLVEAKQVRKEAAQSGHMRIQGPRRRRWGLVLRSSS